jgi:tetratricopeptide (TPR) repeat protein
LIEYLWDLMNQGEYKRCLELAEVELLKVAEDLHSLARLNYVVFFCRMRLGDNLGALASGLLALKIAQTVGDAGLKARTLVNLGWAYLRMRKEEDALTHFYAYIDHLERTGAAADQELMAWKGIAETNMQLMRPDEAVKAFERVVLISERQGDALAMVRVKVEFLAVLLGGASSDPSSFLPKIKGLLRDLNKSLQPYKDDKFLCSKYYHQIGYFYLYSGRPVRAIVAAHKALRLKAPDARYEYTAHMILFRAYEALGLHKDAFGHALAGRMAAIHAKRFDLEYEAAEHMTELLQRHGPRVMAELDREYQGMGIDLGQFISPNLIHRRSN